eukprot:g33435.t1
MCSRGRAWGRSPGFDGLLQTWADARETNAMIASVRAQGIYILESFGNAGLSERFRMLWPPMQPWRQAFGVEFAGRIARLLLRLALSALLAALARQLVFGAFSADAEDAAPEVCGQRPEGLAEVLPLALICHGIARLSSSLLDAACMLQRGCLCCRWVAVSQGLLSSVVIVILFLSNTSDADGLWWMFCFLLILLLDRCWLDLALVPFVATFLLAAVSTCLVDRGVVNSLLEEFPNHDAPVQAQPAAAAKITINSEPSVTTGKFAIPPEELIQRAMLYLAKNQYGVEDPNDLADDFLFVIGPLEKDEFIKTLGQFDLKVAFPDQKVRWHDFRVDPYEPSRVWFTARSMGTHLGCRCKSAEGEIACKQMWGPDVEWLKTWARMLFTFSA